MASFLNAKVYLGIALFTAGLCALIVYFDTDRATAAFFADMATGARPFLGAGITNVIFTPLQMIFSDYFWAVGAGIAWPLVAIWMFLMLFGVGATIVGPTLMEVNSL